MRYASLALAVSALAGLAACKRAPDPLASYLTECEKLQQAKELKAGLTVKQCAERLKAAADEADPERRAGELLSRLATLAGQKDPKKNGDEMRAAVDSLTILGRPAVAPSLARLESSSDTEFRAGVARALVSICMSDCAKSDYNCIVPALLEGVTEALPSDVRMVSVRSLQTCTGQQLGDDPPAWRKWWADLKQRGASTAAR